MFRNTQASDSRHPCHGTGRFRGGPFGHGPRGRARSFMGGDGAPSGRKLTSDDLQLVLLALLAEQPAHGYELIRTLADRSGGFYAPSSGMVYPALTYLDEIGLAASTTEANRKLYALTEGGRSHLAERRAEADAILHALTRMASRMEEVRDAYAGLGAADPDAADALHEARSSLKHALKRAHDCTPAQAQRIVSILQRATAEILGATDGPTQ